MKLHTETTTLEQIGNVTEAQGFKMRSSRKAFKILSDLYSDKPLAIVRELGCNAHDSHVQAGKADVPFHIHAPNALEPWITIQDFGTGISHEDITNIYAVYFESTKTNTNDEIGCLGLGSKSPFCYTDNFTITSNFDGVKRIYNAYFNETTMPTIALMSTEDTTEGNGIKIQIPVKPEDFQNFYNAIKKSFRFFDVRPTISGGSVVWDDEKPVLSGNDWMVYKSFGYNEAFAIMGGVPYPLDCYKLNEKNRNIVQRSGLVLKFNIGELDIVPSREGLSYDAPTIKALNDKMEKVVEDIKATITTTLASQPDVYEAIMMYKHLENKFLFLGNQIQNLKWNNIEISNPIKLIWDLFIQNKMEKDSNHVTNISKSNWGRSQYNTGTTPSFKENALWYVNNLKKGAVARAKQFVKDNSDKEVCLYSEDAKKVLIDFGFPASLFHNASDLLPVQKAKAISKTTTPVTDYTIYKIGCTWKQSWESEKMDINNPIKFYIEKGKDWNLDIKLDGLHTIYDKGRLLTLLNHLRIKSSEVALVSKRNLKTIASLSTNFIDYAKANLNLDYDADETATYEKHLSNSWGRSRILDIICEPNFTTLKDCALKKFILRLKDIIDSIDKKNSSDIFSQMEKKGIGTAEKMDGDAMETYVLQALLDGSFNCYEALKVMNIWQESK